MEKQEEATQTELQEIVDSTEQAIDEPETIDEKTAEPISENKALSLTDFSETTKPKTDAEITEAPEEKAAKKPETAGESPNTEVYGDSPAM